MFGGGDEDDEFGSSANFTPTQATQPVALSQDEEDSDGGDADEVATPAKKEFYWGRLTQTERSSQPNQRVYLNANECTIGRGKNATMILVEPSVSTMHLLITRDEDNPNNFKIVDQSANGTFLNGRKLSKGQVYALHSGDLLSLVKREPPSATSKDYSRVKRWFQIVFESGSWDVSCHSDNAGTESHGIRSAAAATPTAATTATAAAASGQVTGRWGNADADAEATRYQQELYLHRQDILSSEMRRRYELKEQLGNGTFANVYRVVRRDTREEFAVKIIGKAQFRLAPPQKWKDQLNEATLMKKLTHPNVTRLYEIFEDSRGLYLVMELLRGGELFDRIVKSGAFKEPLAKLLVRNLLDAVAYLHDNNVIHRDLKPENIMLVSNGSDVDIKLVDFGVAKEAENGRTTVCGTLDYIAPEVLSRRNTVFGRTRYGKGADMWSLGVVVYVLLTATALFPDSQNMDDVHLMQARVRHALSGPEWTRRHLSISAKEFVSSLLEVNQDRRLTARMALNHPWITSISNRTANGLNPESMQNERFVLPLPPPPSTVKTATARSAATAIAANSNSSVRVRTADAGTLVTNNTDSNSRHNNSALAPVKMDTGLNNSNIDPDRDKVVTKKNYTRVRASSERTAELALRLPPVLPVHNVMSMQTTPAHTRTPLPVESAVPTMTPSAVTVQNEKVKRKRQEEEGKIVAVGQDEEEQRESPTATDAANASTTKKPRYTASAKASSLNSARTNPQAEALSSAASPVK